MEEEIQLDLSVVLPGVEDGDACLDRLESALKNHRGLRRAHLERTPASAKLCLHYDPDILSLAEVRRLAERAGTQLLDRYRHELLPLEGMDCSDCATVIEHSVGRLDGVLAVRVNYAAQTIRIEYDGQRTGRGAIESRVAALGYRLPSGRLRGWLATNRALLFALAASVLALLGWMGSRAFPQNGVVAATLYAGAYLLAGWDNARHAWHALRARSLDTNVLMVTAALGAAALGELLDGAVLLILFGVGHALEERILDRARAAVRALSTLTPKTARVRRERTEVEVPVEQLTLGDIVIVPPGVRVPADGQVAAGQSAIDQAPITGESVPVSKQPGDPVFAGSVNGDGALEVRVTRLSRDSTLARVMRMVEEAQTQKSPTQSMVERFERVFVPAVFAATVVVIFIPPLWGLSFRQSFLRAMTLLVAASPCALALGTPAAILAGIARAARSGVLIKGGVHLENLGRLRAIAFDKTGTLTHGRPEVTDVVVFRAQHAALATESLVLATAAAVEQRSGHPLAQAVIRAAKQRGLPLPDVSGVESLTGRGLRGRVGTAPVAVGNLRLMDEYGVGLDAEARATVASLESRGKTVMVVAVDGAPKGAIAVADTVRPQAATTVNALRRLGVREMVLLSGDNARVAQAIASEVGLTRAVADLMPEDKVNAVQQMVAQFGTVAMVGDGVNDAPALASATVGIAMGGASTDLALETADVVLMADDLSRLPLAVELGRATRSVITQNLALSLAVIAGLVVASLVGATRIGGAIVLHEGTTLAVALNAMRLLAHRAR